jgi:hypothetical protein
MRLALWLTRLLLSAPAGSSVLDADAEAIVGGGGGGREIMAKHMIF